MSDIHGDLKAFKDLIDKINIDFNNDILYLAGDVIDRGKDGLKILKYLSPWLKKQSVKIIKGNHETFCQYYLENKLSGERWSLFGGEHTLQEVNRLTQKERTILRTPYYMDIDCGAGYRKQGGKLACYCIDTYETFYA